MPEHTPNRWIVALMAGFLVLMTGAAVLFWGAALIWTGGVRGVMAAMGPGAMALFGSLHIPAAITGVLLWQWYRAQLSPRLRVGLEAATLYFGGAVLLGLFLNFLLVSFFDQAVTR